LAVARRGVREATARRLDALRRVLVFAILHSPLLGRV
jgi:hypothetical protein